MNSKTLSILSYVTIIGWLISYFSYKGTENGALVRYHLKQGLGIFIVSVLINVVLMVIAFVVPTIAAILSLVGYVVIVLWIFGIINAVNEQQKPVPLVGKAFENAFGFIA